MTTAKTTDKPSTRHHQVDARFAALLEEDFGIPAATVLFALEGEPQKTAIALCEWATEKTDDPAFALTSWARRHGRGAYGTPSAARDGIQETSREHDQASGRTRRYESLRGVLDPVFVRANVQKMAD